MLEGQRPVLSLAIILVFGLIAGGLAKRVKLPSVTGQIAVGVMLGPALLGLFPPSLPESFRGLTEFALALISVSAGSHLNVRRLRNSGKRLGYVVGLDAMATVIAVFLAACFLGGVAWPLALILATMAVETSPGTILSIVKETRSRGVFVKTLIAAVALSDVACIVLFELAHSAGTLALGPQDVELGQIVVTSMKELLGAALIGVGCGGAFLLSARRLTHPSHVATASLLAVLFAWGFTHLAGASSILACVFLGVTLANAPRTRDDAVLSPFTTFEPAIYAVFFTLAGVHLELHHIVAGGTLALIVFFARSFGKWGGVTLGLTLAGAPSRMRNYMGLAMIPHASIAVGLMLLIQSDPVFKPYSEMIIAVGLSVVALSEIIGPLGTRFALARSGEIGQAEPRLLDFLPESNITVDLTAGNKREAIEKLALQLVHTHQLQIDAATLIESVMTREHDVSTCIGEGLMIPHAEIGEGEELLGVMAISRKGLPFETPDGIPVHCVVLLATPPSQRAHHLEVLAALARAIGFDPHLRQQLFAAKTAAHACEVLHAKEATEFNYFMEDRLTTPPSSS